MEKNLVELEYSIKRLKTLVQKQIAEKEFEKTRYAHGFLNGLIFVLDMLDDAPDFVTPKRGYKEKK